MPILQLPGEIMPGQFGPISREFFVFRNSQAFTISSAGMPSVMQTISGMSGVGSFHDRVRSARRRNEDHRRVRAGLGHRFADGIEDGPAFMRSSTLAGSYAAHDLRSVRRSVLGVERSFTACQSLHNQSSFYLPGCSSCPTPLPRFRNTSRQPCAVTHPAGSPAQGWPSALCFHRQEFETRQNHVLIAHRRSHRPRRVRRFVKTNLC